MPLSVPDVLSTLQTGGIDTFYNAPYAAMALQWFTHAKYIVNLKLAVAVGATVLTKAAWDSISAEHQPIVRALTEKWGNKLNVRLRGDNRRAVKVLTTDHGLQVVKLTKAGEEVPTLFFLPKNWNKQVASWITDAGKASLLKEDGSPIDAVQKLIDAGVSVALPDLLYQGEFTPDGQPLAEARKVPNPREFVGYTAGFNHPLFSQRVHDILTLIAFSKYSKYEPEGIHLIGLGPIAGPLVAAAAVQAGAAIDKVAISTGGFRFRTITAARDPMLVPGAVKYGDVPGLLALLAPHRLLLADEPSSSETTKLAQAAYTAANATGKITLVDTPAAKLPAAVAEWLLKS